MLDKLNYKGQKRIAIINTEKCFNISAFNLSEDVIIDKEIDLRCLYSFLILFVKSVAEVELLTPIAIHNLSVDGILWFCYPKKTSKKYTSDIDRNHGWKALNDIGFHGIRLVAIDDDWSAMRFRNIKFIKSKSDRINK